MSVNVSGRQLRDPGFVEDVAEALLESGIESGQLVLEITESVLIHYGTGAMQRLAALERLGVSLAMDDFGTGYSSLSSLHQLPVDILKIDKSFVDAIAGGSDRAALVNTIVQLGQAMDLKVVAEGIEHGAQLAYLTEHECDLGQGYYFSRPLPPEDLHAVLEQSRRQGAVAEGRRS